MRTKVLMLLCFLTSMRINSLAAQQEHREEEAEQLFSLQPKQWNGRVIEVKGGPESVIWVVQLSDLHFSVHQPDRALDFKKIVGPALQMINPSLVLITGDLTDGKSKDLLVMKQNEDEWLEYQNIIEDVVKRSGLDKNIFYDLRGNHDIFGVPVVGGSFDFFSKYSINGQLARRGNVNSVTLEKFFQLNMQQIPSGSAKNCSFGAPSAEEFWEWEMGDWRKSRAMRIMAIDRGHVSYLDIDFKSGAKKTIVLPTFPLDSRFMSTSSWHQKYECQHMVPSSYETIRALVFSVSPIVSVVARIYDARPGTLNIVLETPMTKVVVDMSRGDFYAAPWNHKAFDDPSPDRFWLQIEVIDIMGRSTLSELRPFSVNGLTTKISWTWKEFFVMGCQWAELYYPIFWSVIYLMLSILLIPRLLLLFSKKQYSYKSFIVEKSFFNGIAWVFQDLCRLPITWFGILGYLIYLLLFPWFIGQVFTDGEDKGYMTYMGWVVRSSNDNGNQEYIGSPDIMVVVLPHLIFVVLPATFVAGALAAERGMFKEHFLSLSGKKEDDDSGQMNKKSQVLDKQGDRRLKFYFGRRCIRKVLLVVCLGICWKHFMNCRALMKAYEMNPLFHFPGYSLAIPLLLAYTIYKTRRI
ncbi:putative metallophosphoesterase At3g03305 isoform X3 [Hevea brasiliensis]|uniref:putative metallophosphoesterase At3g03305 isoform X3 n=1 Tax=Hevea brasiliensis TaxID=3981 RepID=UPI0025F13D24|nr:putative metallophosphoesterase At3g03305 isoform X3 [Hevea brasiliensis]